MREKKDRVFGLDLIRAIAITLVLISHVSLFFPNYNNVITDSFQVFGLYGVEIFFVLSGFLIGGILLELIKVTSFSFKNVCNFWVRRWFRTLPLYFLVLSINVLLVFIVEDELPKKLWKYCLFLQNFYNEYLIFFPESWSLSIEEYAYILAPLGLFFISKMGISLKVKRESMFLISAIIFSALCVVLKIVFHCNNIDDNQNFITWNINLKSMVVYRLDAIFIGFILVYFFKKYQLFFEKQKWKFAVIGSIVIMCLLVSIVYYPINSENSLYWNVFFLPLNSIAISLLLPFLYYLNFNYKTVKAFIERVSLYSYSMYLLHYSFAYYLIKHLINLGELDLLDSFLITIVYLIIVYFLSKASYLFYEKPMTDLRDSKTIKRYFN
ncbi:acyltransferase [Seonamhaeicola sp. MEBiC1930]|uniref:acyltransferase family protein n=1 Tax=Seonamhaeicola sp. MEBiC01930 TaxID=2976768 RepID=UPI003243B8D1